MMARFVALAVACVCFCAHAEPFSRRAFLDSIRSAVEARAGQSIRFHIQHLNHDSGWVALYGHLEGVHGNAMDWSKARDCDPELDKSLWIVAQQVSGQWKIRDLYICSPEPPYWYLRASDYARPCGIYRGLDLDTQKSVEDECRARKKP